MKRIARYLFDVLAGCSQLLNTILLGNRDQTLSARTHEAVAAGHRLWLWRPLEILIDAPFLAARHLCLAFGMEKARGWTSAHCLDAFAGPRADEEKTYG